MYASRFTQIVLLLTCAGLLLGGCAPPPRRGVAPAVLVATAVPLTPGPSPTANIVTLRPASTATPLNRPTARPSATPTPAETACAAPFDPVAFLPDSTRLLGIVNTGGQWAAQVFNLETQTAEDEIPAPFAVVKAALSPDGRTLAWALEDHSIRLVRLADHTEFALMEGHLNRITGLKFSSDGRRLFSAAHDRWVRIWDDQGVLIGGLQADSELVGLGVAPDGRRIAMIPMEGDTTLVDLENEHIVTGFAGNISGGYDGSEAVFSPDGQYFAAGMGGAGAISLWRLADDTLLWRGGTFALAFSPDSRLFAHSDFDAESNSLIVLRSADGQQVVRTLTGHAGMVWRLVFSPDSRLLASHDGGPARVWSVADGKGIYAWPPPCGQP